MSTPRCCTLACPRCHGEIPVGVLYGPCASCRSELNAGANADCARRLERVGQALNAGWRSDPARRCWARLEPCVQCAGGQKRRCDACSSTGEVEAIVEWEGRR